MRKGGRLLCFHRCFRAAAGGVVVSVVRFLHLDPQQQTSGWNVTAGGVSPSSVQPFKGLLCFNPGLKVSVYLEPYLLTLAGLC